MDEFWREVADHVERATPGGAGYAGPEALVEALGALGSYAALTGPDADHFTGLVIHKDLYRDIEPAALRAMLARTVPTFANPVFIVLAAQGEVLPRAHPDLGAIADIRRWAGAEETKAAGEESDVPIVDGDSFVGPMARFIAEHLAVEIETDGPEPVIAIKETAHPINDSRWLWIDDAAKVAELFALPEVRAAYPRLADGILTWILRLSSGPTIHRRASPPDLRLVDADPEHFRAYNSFTELTGNLKRGVVSPAIRYNDNRGRVVAEYSGNVFAFTYLGRSDGVDVEDAIVQTAVVEHDDRIVFSHTSAIRAPSDSAEPVHVCDLTYSYAMFRTRPAIELTVRVEAKDGVALSDVTLTTAFDQMSKSEPAMAAAVVGRLGAFRARAFDAPSPAQLAEGSADYLCLYESRMMPGFANGLHGRLREGSRLASVVAERKTPIGFHWVYLRYRIGDLAGGQAATIVEDRLMTGGGYYDRPEIAVAQLESADEPALAVDPSVSYDTGAELNAVATTIFFSRSGAYGETSLPEARVTELRAWYDRHLKTFLDGVRPKATGERPAIFVRGLSFVALSLDCMARAFPEAGYGAALRECVDLLLALELPVAGAYQQSLFGPPELDTHASALLAFARTAQGGDPTGRLTVAIRRGLRAILLARADSDPGKRVFVIYDTLLVRQDALGTAEDTGFWVFKLGLALRAFNSIRRMQELGALALDPDTLDHLDALSERARAALEPALRQRGDSIEALTSHKSGETNSETQPWVALGLEPAIEWRLLGKPAPGKGQVPVVVGASVGEKQPARVYFDQGAGPISVETECDEAALSDLVARVAATWEKIGQTRPHWSVLSEDRFAPARIVETEEVFHATGEHDRNRLLAAIRRSGRDPADFSLALDYGCGLGRVTNYLAQTFERVVACDVSRSHLDLARARSATIGRANIDYRLARPADFGMIEPFDLFYSRIVLQHNPPPIMGMVIRQALSLLRPGGLAVFQLPTYAPDYRFETREYLLNAPPAPDFEMHVFPQPKLFELIHAAGCRVVEVFEDAVTGNPSWLSDNFVVAK